MRRFESDPMGRGKGMCFSLQKHQKHCIALATLLRKRGVYSSGYAYYSYSNPRGPRSSLNTLDTWNQSNPKQAYPESRR